MSLPSNSRSFDTDTDPIAGPSVDGTSGMNATPSPSPSPPPPPTAAEEEREPSAMVLRIADELFSLLDQNALDETSSLQRNWEQLRQLDAGGGLEGGIERVKHDVLRFMVENGLDTGDDRGSGLEEESMMDALKDCLSDHMDLYLPDPYCSSGDDELDESDSVSEDQEDNGSDSESESDEYLALRSQASMRSD